MTDVKIYRQHNSIDYHPTLKKNLFKKCYIPDYALVMNDLPQEYRQCILSQMVVLQGHTFYSHCWVSSASLPRFLIQCLIINVTSLNCKIKKNVTSKEKNGCDLVNN